MKIFKVSTLSLSLALLCSMSFAVPMNYSRVSERSLKRLQQQHREVPLDTYRDFAKMTPQQRVALRQSLNKSLGELKGQMDVAQASIAKASIQQSINRIRKEIKALGVFEASLKAPRGVVGTVITPHPVVPVTR